MLREIETPDRVAECVEKAKDKSSSFRLMGFGHRWVRFDCFLLLMQ
jgi:citrate synthase